MRYRWDPAYPMGRRDFSDTSLRASDDERNAVADKLSRHYAEGRLDEAEFKNRLDTAMSATTRGDLNGLFHDLPHLPSDARHLRRGVDASCRCSSWWRSSSSSPAPPSPSIPCTTCRGSLRDRRLLPVAELQRPPPHHHRQRMGGGPPYSSVMDH